MTDSGYSNPPDGRPTGEERPGREVATLTPELVQVAIGELVGLVNTRLPERFYTSACAALLVILYSAV